MAKGKTNNRVLAAAKRDYQELMERKTPESYKEAIELARKVYSGIPFDEKDGEPIASPAKKLWFRLWDDAYFAYRPGFTEFPEDVEINKARKAFKQSKSLDDAKRWFDLAYNRYENHPRKSLEMLGEAGDVANTIFSQAGKNYPGSEEWRYFDNQAATIYEDLRKVHHYKYPKKDLFDREAKARANENKKKAAKAVAKAARKAQI